MTFEDRIRAQFGADRFEILGLQSELDKARIEIAALTAKCDGLTHANKLLQQQMAPAPDAAQSPEQEGAAG